MNDTTPVSAPPVVGDHQFRLLVDGVIDYAIFLLDLNGIVTTWNAGARRIKGYTAEEIIGRHFSVFYPPEERALGTPDQALATARRDGRDEREGWRLRKDGTRFWANAILDAIKDESGTIIGFAKITRDITDRRAAERALLESEERFRLLVEGVTDYAIYFLDTGGHVTNWNAGGRKIKGYAPSEIIGQHFSKFYTLDDVAAGLPAHGLETAAREGRFENEGWRLRKDGTRFWASIIIDAIRDKDGKLLGFAKVTRDITERRMASEQLAKAQMALAQAQKMEAVGQLTGGVAHDFNNLLTVVINNLEIVRGRMAEGRDRRLLESAFRAAERGAKLTQQLLAFARRQPLRPAAHSPKALIGDFEPILRRGAGETVEMVFKLEAGGVNFSVDAAQFEAALLNLVVNARDAMPNGGRITVTTRTVIVDRSRADLFSVAPGSYIEVTVSDTGVGMNDQVKAQAIEPFFTTKEVGKGSGLGLSQVYGFVTQSGGQLQIKSEPGLGTAVSLFLPVASGAAAEKAVEEPEPEMAGGTVLVVEDDPDVLETLLYLMRELGCQVLTAPNAASAIEIMKREGHIDLLFSDVMLPKGMSGIELAEHTAAVHPDIRIVLASGYPKTVLSKDNGAIERFTLLNKPYRWAELSETIRGAIRSPARH